MMQFPIFMLVFRLWIPVLVIAAVSFGIYRVFRRNRQDTTYIRTEYKEQIEQKAKDSDIFKLAEKKGGVLSVSDVVINLNLSAKDAETRLQELADDIHVIMVVKDDGAIRFDFPELKD